MHSRSSARDMVECGDSRFCFLRRSWSESAQSKMLSGIGGFVLGLIFLGLGLIVHHRSQKGKELWGNGNMGCD